MIGLHEKLEQNIAFVIEQAGIAAESISNRPLGTELALQLDLVTSEIALIALVTADALEGIKSETAFMTFNELARRLKEIAFLCLDVQETDEEKEIRSLINTINDSATSVADYTGLPKYAPREETDLVAVSGAKPDFASKALQLRPDGENDVEKLRAEIRALRELLASLVLERDNLINVVLRDIEATYMRELGGLEAEAYQAECEARILKARLEMMQASLNREETIQKEKIDDTIRKQYEEYRKVYEEFIRRIFEANAYSQRRAEQKAKTKRADKQNDNKDSVNEKATHDTSLGAANEESSETEEQELKRLYRKIVKAMHPDLHPDQDEATKELFKRAILAYKDFDLKTLREIAAMLEGEIPDSTENLLDALQKERTRLLELIRGIRVQIRNVKSRYPYTQKKLLDDPVRLAEEKDKLNKRIGNAKRAAEIYQERITEIMRRNGRNDPSAE